MELFFAFVVFMAGVFFAAWTKEAEAKPRRG